MTSEDNAHEEQTESIESKTTRLNESSKPPNVRIRHYPDHERYPDGSEDAVAVVQFTAEVVNGCKWTGENIPIGLETDDGLYRMALTPEFIDELRKSPYWDTVTARLDE